MENKDINNMDDKKLLGLQKKLGNDLAKILNNANKKANSLLNPFGMEVKIGYVLDEKNKEKEE